VTRITTDPAEAVAVLHGGGLVGLPTETVYGLAADATRADAVRAVYAAKGRPLGHPLIVHLAGSDRLDAWAAVVPDAARVLADHYWPGPVTILLRRHARVLDEITGGRDTVALRVPDHLLSLAVLDALPADGGLVAPSANRFGRVSPTTAQDVVDELGDVVDLVLDGGPCTVGIESAIVDLSGPLPRLLRAGAVPLDELAGLVPGLTAADEAAPAVAPGMLASHYAPDATVVVVGNAATWDEVAGVLAGELARGRRVGLLTPAVPGPIDAEVVVLDAGPSAADYARRLYGRLREADALGLDVVVAVAPSPEGAGAAVLDRLRRAAHPRPADRPR
jgi:L-threonylcarbamoyladenylate synthase